MCEDTVLASEYNLIADQRKKMQDALVELEKDISYLRNWYEGDEPIDKDALKSMVELMADRIYRQRVAPMIHVPEERLWPQYNSPREIMDACGLPDIGANLPDECEHCGRRKVWIRLKGLASTCPACAIRWLREEQARNRQGDTEQKAVGKSCSNCKDGGVVDHACNGCGYPDFPLWELDPASDDILSETTLGSVK